ncbi:MAG: hypothetical protein ACJ71I_16665 [Nitrososphaeraceae archaeon]
MYGIIDDSRVVYSAKGKVEGIVQKAKLHERIAAGIDRDDFAYDYNYDITEDDNYYKTEIGNNNDTNTTTITKHNTYKKNHLSWNFSKFPFVVFAISSVLLGAS